MTVDEALKILAAPEAYSQAQVDEAVLVTIKPTDNAAGPEDGEQPAQPVGGDS